MRSTHRIQPSLPIGQIPHKHALQLRLIAQILDGLPQLEEQVLADLVPAQVRRDVGRDGLSAQQVLRVLVLYLLLKVDFEQLEFHLADSLTYRAFCLLGVGDSPPKRACLQHNISRVRPQTLQALHRILVEQAVQRGVESGHAVRIDTTPVAAPIRAPLDSALLGDAVRVLCRLLKRAQKLVPMSMPSHHRRVGYRTKALRAEKLDEDERAALYFDLLQDTKRYVEAAFLAADFLDGVDDEKAFTLAIHLRAQAEAALCIVDQTERRVLHGQKVPATAKRVSMFEAHADMLCKRNQICFGHKVCLAFGKTGGVLAAEMCAETRRTLRLPLPPSSRASTTRTAYRTMSRWTLASLRATTSATSRHWVCSASPSLAVAASTDTVPAAVAACSASCTAFSSVPRV